MTKDEALKLALEYVDLVPDDRYNAEHIDREALVTAIKEALAQPEQEPFMASYEFKQYGYYKDGKGTLKLGNIPATQPPQRTWVGLTDDERESIANATIRIHGQEWAYATAIEAKLKEKNT